MEWGPVIIFNQLNGEILDLPFFFIFMFFGLFICIKVLCTVIFSRGTAKVTFYWQIGQETLNLVKVNRCLNGQFLLL